MIREAWSGEEWQTHCRQLLAMRFGDDIQFIPDRDRGDGGLEAYRLDRPVAYQCYAPQESFDVKSQTDAQKRKIATDIRKLVDKPDQTCELIGQGTVLERWILLTPDYDSKELVKFARTKSLETRRNGRPIWCHEDFQVVIHTDELFAAERALLLGTVSSSLSLEVPTPTPEVLQETARSPVGETLRGKLVVDPLLASDESLLEGYIEETLIDYIRGSDQYRTLENQYTSSYAMVKSASDSTLRSLTRAVSASSSPGPEMTEELVRELAAKFASVCPSISSILATDLARYFVATWFIQCPLRFKAQV